MVVVVIVIFVVSVLFVYMAFLACLDPILNKKVKSGDDRIGYKEHYDENEWDDDEEEARAETEVSDSVMDRLGNQQNKWQRKVLEQRKNIYDRHAMLN